MERTELNVNFLKFYSVSLLDQVHDTRVLQPGRPPPPPLDWQVLAGAGRETHRAHVGVVLQHLDRLLVSALPRLASDIVYKHFILIN